MRTCLANPGHKWISLYSGCIWHNRNYSQRRVINLKYTVWVDIPLILLLGCSFQHSQMCLFKKQGFALQGMDVWGPRIIKKPPSCAAFHSLIRSLSSLQPFRREKYYSPWQCLKKLHWAHLDRNSRMKAVYFFKKWQDNSEVLCHGKDLRVERLVGLRFARDKLLSLLPAHPLLLTPFCLLFILPIICSLIHSFLL